MKIGFVGCGKLGLMVALAIESKGHQVKGYDVSEWPSRYLRMREIPFHEEHSRELLAKTEMRMVALPELCQWADIIFMAPHTPHAPEYEGSTPLPANRVDFDYSHLIECVKDVNSNLLNPKPCAIISTVLPGTIEREILPFLSNDFRLVYSPQFIAMGTVYQDFLSPEFWLIGARDAEAAETLKTFYETIAYVPSVVTDIRTAEAIKVFYNTFITTKTVLANLYGEMAHRLGLNVDDIYRTLCLSTERLLSPRYLKAGMGDGGGCHPRDNIALSYLARKTGCSFDFFDALMTAREKHCEFLADEIEKHETILPIVILGSAFKPETNIITGSPSVLLSNILKRRGLDHRILEDPTKATALYFIGCQHERYQHVVWPIGSTVIDPFRYIAPQQGVTLVSIGKGDSAIRDHRTLESAHRA